MATAASGSPVCDLYKVMDSYIGQIDLPIDVDTVKDRSPELPETYIILDVSGSMDINVEGLVRKVIPKVLMNLRYTANEVINLITFGSFTQNYKMTIKDFFDGDFIKAGGCTYMNDVPSTLKELLSISKKKNIRMLIISDGIIEDQEVALAYATSVAALMRPKFNIFAHGIRLKTTDLGTPDTRAISGILQFNTFGMGKLIDLNGIRIDHEYRSSFEYSGYEAVFNQKDIEQLVVAMTNLFKDDVYTAPEELVSSDKVIQVDPWTDSELVYNCRVTSGKRNTFWFKSLPSKLFITQGSSKRTPVEIRLQETNASNIEVLMQDKIAHYLERLRVLKVINTRESLDEIKHIVNYFEKFQSYKHDVLEIVASSTKMSNSLVDRVAFFKRQIKSRERSNITELLRIAKDGTVASLNSAQAADYLRQAGTSRNAKNMASRAVQEGIDFDSKIREEVCQIAKHIEELSTIDDSSHACSFYSQNTTLGGLRVLADMVKQENMINQMDAAEIIKMFNIVGIACNGPIGDYPDPMTWHINQIYPGCYISVADIAMAFHQSHGKALSPAGYPDAQITNVIPFFEDERVLMFLKKYAPESLEYIASVGMRRIITGIPMTHGYTVCTGIMALTRHFKKNPSEIATQSLMTLMKNYNLQCGNYFERYSQHIRKGKLEDPCHIYLEYAGMKQMLQPIYRLLEHKAHREEMTKVQEVETVGEENEKRSNAYISKVLRSIYANEFTQRLKKTIKQSIKEPETLKSKAEALLHQLLSIDLNKNCTVPQDPFVKEPPNPIFCDVYVESEDVIQQFSHLEPKDLITWPILLQNNLDVTQLKALLTTKENRHEAARKTFGLPYSYRRFIFYNLVQALMYIDLQDRESTTGTSHIIDPIDLDAFEESIRKYIETLYRRKYEKLLKEKVEKETTALGDEFVYQFVFKSSIHDCEKLLVNGITRSGATFKLPNSTNKYFDDIVDLLKNMEYTDIEDRAEKCCLLMTGESKKGLYIWNNGNVVRKITKDCEEIYRNCGRGDEWESIAEKIFDKSGFHIYRESDLPNSHGHCNSNPSGWALGLGIDADSICEIEFGQRLTSYNAYMERIGFHIKPNN